MHKTTIFVLLLINNKLDKNVIQNYPLIKNPNPLKPIFIYLLPAFVGDVCTETCVLSTQREVLYCTGLIQKSIIIIQKSM